MRRLDYEVELAIVIGKTAKDVKPEEAGDYIFGYTVLNDVSARLLQTEHKQWYFGKSLDGFFPYGALYRHGGGDQLSAPSGYPVLCQWGIEAEQHHGPSDF